MRMRTLWFGGTFNPIHSGHLICARAVAETAGFEQVVLVPNRQPPHKAGDTTIAPAVARLDMCRLAVQGDNFFHVDDLEINRAGPSYTIDTVKQLKGTASPEIAWLIGADMLNQLPHWHNAIGLLAHARLVVMARPGWVLDWLSLPMEMQVLKYNVITAPQLEISSTTIRTRLTSGRSIRYLTPDAVVQYIVDKKLYHQAIETPRLE